MESFSLFDLIVAAIILLLGLKGLLNGFFKELFGLIGIIGGIFVASRFDATVGEWISSAFFNFNSTAAATFTGFLLTLAIFWLGMTLLGSLFSSLSDKSGLGIFNRVLGFAFGSGKIFLIFAIIAYSISHIKIVSSYVDSSMKSSIIYPLLIETGEYIVQIDLNEIQDSLEPEESLEKKIDSKSDSDKNLTVESSVINKISQTLQSVKTDLAE